MLVYCFSWIEKNKTKGGGGGGESYKDMTNECPVRIFARYQLPLCDIIKPMLSFIHRLNSYKYTAKPLLKPFDWYWAIGKDMKCDILRLHNATTSLLVVKAGINLLNDYYIVIIGNMVYKVMIIPDRGKLAAAFFNTSPIRAPQSADSQAAANQPHYVHSDAGTDLHSESNFFHRMALMKSTFGLGALRTWCNDFY